MRRCEGEALVCDQVEALDEPIEGHRRQLTARAVGAAPHAHPVRWRGVRELVLERAEGGGGWVEHEYHRPLTLRMPLLRRLVQPQPHELDVHEMQRVALGAVGLDEVGGATHHERAGGGLGDLTPRCALQAHRRRARISRKPRAHRRLCPPCL